ncbi:MAG: asparagine synthase (glutamine-hydrolyzing) [Cyclobacteriaceae bacterium]|nr:asparagine synthase (glutamine-hydrolyzing) [Cyclobacteriaceae bacterium]
MCGLTGFVDFNLFSRQEHLEQMKITLLHRGPDDHGQLIFKNDQAVVGLAQTRLSIIDVSPLGHQPMRYKRLCIVLNGEIYNYKEIKNELKSLGHSFVSNSDTEVVLHAFEEWRLNCVDRFIGMFAFLIYDQEQEKIFACRDRVGVKPFFYYWNSDLFLFTSELKSFHKHPGFKKELNKKSLVGYLQHGYVSGPKTIFKDVYKLEPGTWLTVDLSTRKLSLNKYWNIEEYFKKPLNKSISYQEAKVELEKLMLSAFQYRMIADVPVGVFLSGGFDSTLVTALLQKHSTKKLNTFTIGFPDGVNEAPYAAMIAKHLGTDHISYDCTESDAKEIIPHLAYYYDEPCADISAIPSILVSRLAKQKVTVALSADGGDELFVGYDGFKTSLNRLNAIRKIPFPKRIAPLLRVLAGALPVTNLSIKRKALGMADVLRASHESQLQTLLGLSDGIPKDFVKMLLANNISDSPVFYEKMELYEERNHLLMNCFKGSLKDLLLVKIDRATMSVGLEGREPLLDHRLIEYTAQLPFEFKYDGIVSKKIVRDIVYQYVPKEMMDRPKTGFDLPIYKWLRQDLSYLLDEHLGQQSINLTGVFNAAEVAKVVSQFNSGNLVYTDIIWRLLHFQMWYRMWMS